MAELKTKRLSTAEVIDEPSADTYILVEEDGALKRISIADLKAYILETEEKPMLAE